MITQSTPRAASTLERLIAAHPAVQRCAVVTADEAGKGLVLVAHYVLWPTADVCAEELREYVAQRLPPNLPPLRLQRHATFPPPRCGSLDLQLMSR